jgi:predicted lipoprotein with Yx(FWY)xxD motif
MRSFTKPTLILIVILSSIALLAAACGGDDGYGGSSATTTPAASGAQASPSAAAASGDVVKVADTSKGKVLTDSSGMTLYTFKTDATTPGKSACNSGCSSTWPALTASNVPTAVTGASGAFASITRDDGAKQLTYNGQPLYRYAGDKSPGQTNGDGIGGVWFVASVTAQATSAASPAPTMAADSGNGYYGY